MPGRPLLLAGVTAAAGVLLFWRIGAYPLTDGDAAYYARIARNIVDTGELLILRFDPTNGGSGVDKPPLAMWAMAASFGLLGVSDLAARLWHAVLALGLVVETYLLGRRLAGREVGALAALVLLTAVMFFYEAREPLLDIPLTACVTGALLLLAWEPGFPPWARVWSACAVVGLGVMFKGPVAIALLVPPVGLSWFMLASDRRPALRDSVLPALAGVAILLAVVLPWHLWIYTKLGPGFFDMYAGAMSWRRYLQPLFPPGLPVLVYAVFLFGAMVPWAGFVAPALRAAWQDGRGEPRTRLFGLLVVWAVLFFGLSRGPIFGKYLLPALPALAVLVALRLAGITSAAARRAGWATFVAGAVVIAVGVAAGVRDVLHAGLEVGVVVSWLGASMVAGGVALVRGRMRGGTWLLAAGSASAYVLLLAIGLPKVLALYPERQFAGLVNEVDGRAARVGVFRTDSLEPMAAFYLDAARIVHLNDEAALSRFLDGPGGAWILERPGQPLPAPSRARLDVVASAEGARLLHHSGRTAPAQRGQP